VFEVRNLLTVSEAIARSARHRTESRGAHSRIDYPDTNDTKWGHVNSVVAKGKNGRMTVRNSPLAAIPDDLRGLLGGAH